MIHYTITVKLEKVFNHSHFWIENETFFESYSTIIRLRYLELFKVKGMPDYKKCTEAMINYIEKEYMN